MPKVGEYSTSLLCSSLIAPRSTIRIAEAERALVLRARELFHESGDNIEEAEALDNAMYSLNALRNVRRCGQDSVQQSQRQAA